MIQRPVSPSQPGGRGHCPMHEVEGVFHGACERPTVREAGGDGGR